MPEANTVWVKSRTTGHVHAMSPEFAAYYLNQRDPGSNTPLYEEADEPSAGGQDRLSNEDLQRIALENQAARAGRVPTPVATAAASPFLEMPVPRHGVPDAARMQVATSEGEYGPTMGRDVETKEVTTREYAAEGGPDRIQEGEKAAETGQTAAHAEAKEAAAKAARKAQKGDK